ncbi:alpha/beta hydrolase family protein [Pseudomonas kuykendallii]|uniref:alpha/beta hydrolase family protein n=1 Tax=Pseudomonas kuykendallii TaxID=1007099 RepID=UPI0028D07A84|nr:alpha/beta hydrolase family protein [Pseudomonas kuykendallii]
MSRSILPPLCIALLLGASAVRGAEPAAAPAPPVERAPLEERSQDEAIALQRQLPTAEQHQLEAGGERFLALWKPANSATPSGLVILLPGEGEHPDWPRVIGPLRSKLADAGWHTLSLSLPDPLGDPLPARVPEAIEPAKEGDAAKTDPPPATGETPPAASAEDQRKAHGERVMARIQAALDFAAGKQVKTVVLLGHGSGAFWAASFLAERKPAQIHQLLMVEASVPAGYAPPLEELVPPLKLATGDIYYKDRYADAALARRQASKRLQHPAYALIGLDALPANPDAEQEQLARRVRGWLTRNVGEAKK